MTPRAVTVADVTGREDVFTLDTHGFQFLRHASVETDFTDEDSIKTVYYPEAERLYKQITGATRVVIFNHQIRRGPANWHSLGERNTEHRGPLHKAHVDQSYDGAVMMARHHLGAEADGLLDGRRFQIINLWRPIETVRKDPLAVADGKTVAEEDLVAGAIIYPRHRAETWTIKPNPAHRWYYKNRQRPDEPLLIKCFDSDESVVRRAAHCAFRDPEMDDMEHRQSIDIRALVFH
ncbi:Gibberellin cluster GA4 desaturase [Colletotrichum trifolii]|uniref:Gibberellin cluster GA4 desaturase n=1 Tax=Colletotrichum trifolii TaxID=5466 RepID=A0A4R8QCX9_COLTR|nr:Gibberellin cluster GA4 desaturase [Colletotrichum trifolii]